MIELSELKTMMEETRECAQKKVADKKQEMYSKIEDDIFNSSMLADCCETIAHWEGVDNGCDSVLTIMDGVDESSFLAYFNRHVAACLGNRRSRNTGVAESMDNVRNAAERGTYSRVLFQLSEV